MNHVTKAMYYAWMSQASYLDLANNQISKELIDSNYAKDKEFSQAQADDFTNHFNFAHHTPNNKNGFSATAFASKADNSFTIAMRGTEPSEGFGALYCF